MAGLPVQGAVDQVAGTFTLPGKVRGEAARVEVPSFCRVTGTLTPTPDSIIHFEVWLPVPTAWNHKLEGVGNHAFLGAIDYPGMAAALQRGYAAAATDTGHTGDDLGFGLGHSEKIIDWAYRAVHLTTDVAKLIVRNYYGSAPSHSYFVGCDSGGQEGLTEALRYPDDYDGIVAGNPAADRLHEVIGYLGQWEATHDGTGHALLPESALRLLTKAALEACDRSDGVADGVIEDPEHCEFDPASLTCNTTAGSDCLTREQVLAAKSMYRGIRNPRTGKMVFPGWAIGSEAFGDSPALSWRSIVGGEEPRRVELLKNFVFSNPNWDWHTMNFDADIAYADEVAGVISATSNDLSSFHKSGGKLLLSMGWSDPILPAADVIESYEAKVKTAGGKTEADNFLRLYMVPGMGHCGGGPGTTSFDMVTVLEQWQEHKIAPQRVVAIRALPNGKERSRPLCPYPQTAHWNGKGSTDDATSFVCQIPATAMKP